MKLTAHEIQSGLLIVTLVAILIPPVIHQLFKRFAPLVVVQIAVGIIAGPTVVGALFPEAFAHVAHPQVIAIVKEIGTIAVLIFAFAIGMHLDIGEFFKDKKEGNALLLTSMASLVIPLIIGFPVGLWFGAQEGLVGPHGNSFTFAFAFAIAVSVTALPVLAAAIKQMGYDSKRVGKIALTAAVFNDGALWILLAVFMALVAAQTSGLSAVGHMVFWSVVYGICMFFVARPLVRRVTFDSPQARVAAAIGFALASALATHIIGLHAILGAVVAGMCMPSEVKHQLEGSLGKLNETIFLPFFFISTGLQTHIPLQGDMLFWTLAFGATFLTAITKLFPTAFVAHATGLFRGIEPNVNSFRDSMRYSYKLGAFMTAKGLMEIVVLTIMLQTGVISDTAFGAMIVMALLATALTMPLVNAIEKAMAKGPCVELVEVGTK